MMTVHENSSIALALPTTASPTRRISVVVPCYNVRSQILSVLERIGNTVDNIYVVDDLCPQQSGRFVQETCRDSRVRVIFHAANQGVGGAVLSGIEAALLDKMDIVVKIDGDGQMDPALLPLFVRPIIAGEADVTKGNRFYNPEDVAAMPALRLLGNAGLSFLAKLSTGYWNLFDPNNGYIAMDSRVIEVLPRHKIDRRYFFETDLLFRLGLARAKVMDIPMRAVYQDEISNLKIGSEAGRFLVRNFLNCGKRIFYNYLLRDFNIGSLELFCGILLTAFGLVYGLSHWGGEMPATAGRVMVAALPLLSGIFFLVSFINYDAQQIPRDPISPRLSCRT